MVNDILWSNLFVLLKPFCKLTALSDILLNPTNAGIENCLFIRSRNSIPFENCFQLIDWNVQKSICPEDCAEICLNTNKNRWIKLFLLLLLITFFEKFLKFNTFSCIFKAFFRFPSPVRGEDCSSRFSPGYDLCLTVWLGIHNTYD